MGFIGGFLLPEDRYAALLLYGMVLPICFAGYDAGIVTVILANKQFIAYYEVTPSRCGTIASIPWAATGLAQIFVGGTLSALIGRLWTLRLSIGVITTGVGLGFGCIYIATSLYVAECAPKRLRGSFVGTVTQFGFQLGTLIAFWAGYGMSSYTEPENIAWRISNLIQTPIGLLFVGLSFWYPESPRWLLEKDPQNPSKALKQLAKIRSAAPDDLRVQTEYRELIASYEYRKKFDPGYRGIVRNPALRKRLCYGLYATALQQIGGIAALTMYAALIYESLGWDSGRQALAINGVQSVLQLCIVFVNTFTVDRFGRKTLLIWGFGIQSIALLILSSLTTSFPENQNKGAAIVEVAMIFIVGLTYCWSNGPIAFVIASEIFPQHVREKAFGLSLLGQTACLLALTQPWPAFNAVVEQRSYWLLFSLNVAAMISVIFVLPETKDISLERMDVLFGEVDAVEAGERELAFDLHQDLNNKLEKHTEECGNTNIHPANE